MDDLIDKPEGGDDAVDEDDDEADIMIWLTSNDPNTCGNTVRWVLEGRSSESRNLFRFTLDGEYEQFKFTEEMIDHLDIESKIIVAECNEAKLQVRKFGIPPLIGMI